MPIERKYDPDREPSHPGSIIRDYMEAEGLDQGQLAQALDLSRPYLNQIINGRAGISEEVAIKLGKVFGTTAELWANLDTKRKLWEERQAQDRVPADMQAAAEMAQKTGAVFIEASMELSYMSSWALFEIGRQLKDTHESLPGSLASLLVSESMEETESSESSSDKRLETTFSGDDDQHDGEKNEYDRFRNFELSTA